MGRTIGGFFALLAGLGIFWGTWALSQSTLKLKTEAVKTEGTVIDFKFERSTRIGRSDMYAPIVEYTTAEGQTLTFTSSLSSSSPPYDRGEKVKVLYSKITPEQARIDSFMEHWLGPLISGVFAVTFTLLGSWFFFGGIKKSQKYLKTFGFPALATVLEANSKTGILKYRIDKETRVSSTRIPSETEGNFISLENTVYDWKPSQADVGLNKGDQYRAYLDAQKPYKNFYVDFSDKIGYDLFVKSSEEESIEDEEVEKKLEKELIVKLKNIATRSSPYLSKESSSEIFKLIEDEELILAFEKLMTGIMDLPKPLPVPFQSVNWDDCLEISAYLETEYDFEFWTKFEAFEKEIK